MPQHGGDQGMPGVHRSASMIAATAPTMTSNKTTVSQGEPRGTSSGRPPPQITTHSPVAQRSGDESPRLWTIIEESALRRINGSAKIMAAQREHLVKMSERPNIVVQIIPESEGSTVAGGREFTIMPFTSEPTVVYLEDVGSANIFASLTTWRAIWRFSGPNSSTQNITSGSPGSGTTSRSAIAYRCSTRAFLTACSGSLEAFQVFSR